MAEVTAAALLPTPGDPWLLRYWLAAFRAWADQVDELVVLVNGQRNLDALAELDRMVAEAHPDATTVAVGHRVEHGPAIAYLLERARADLVVLCEDDAYARDPLDVAASLDAIRAGAVDGVWSPRHDDRSGAWPCFLFARRADLLATDRRFGVVPGQQGQQDTMTHAARQLRAAGLRFAEHPQEHLQGGQPAGSPWVHVGSLSTGYGILLPDAAGLAELLDGAGARLLHVGGEPSRRLWAHRCWWWLRYWRTANGTEVAERLPEQHGAYLRGIHRVVATAGLRDYLDEFRYDDLITWPE